MTKILVATDAWHPQVNGVVRTLTMMAEAAGSFGVEIVFLTPQSFRTFAMPSYPDLRLALPHPADIAELIARAKPDSIHIATEGPIGWLVRRYCRKYGVPFTTSFHTRFPEYVSVRTGIPQSWGYWVLRRFHAAGAMTMVATNSLREELSGRGFTRLGTWTRGVDTKLFNPDEPAHQRRCAQQRRRLRPRRLHVLQPHARIRRQRARPNAASAKGPMTTTSFIAAARLCQMNSCGSQ